MWKSPVVIDKYEYSDINPYIVRLLGLLGFGATLIMGYGLLRYLRLDSLYILIFGPIVLIFIINKATRYFIQLFYQSFSTRKHIDFINRFWLDNDEPSIDVFLPWAGEDLQMHEDVLRGVSMLNYKNYKVYMLDDKGSEEHKHLANKYGFSYLSRPNKGEFKKSGNLMYGYENSNGKYVFILDADFIPEKNALKDLVPYMEQDREIGILQTPQYFEQSSNVHKRSHIEFGGGNIVEDFYKIIMPCRDEFKAGMCVGTSALYRRSTIESLEGTPKVHASEDLATGLLITQTGYYVKYLPLIVSIGKSPENYEGYFRQHLRWCSGNVVFAKYWPKAKLSLMGRLIYLINPMYYLSDALTVVFSFQFLILLYFHSNSLSIWHSLYFIPYLIVNNILMPMSKANREKAGTKLAALSNSYTYFYTFLRLLTKGIPAWTPAGVKAKTLQRDFLNSINLGVFISSIYLILLTTIVINKIELFGNYNAYAVLAWSFYTAFWHTLYLHLSSRFIHPFRIATAKHNMEKAFLYVKTHFTLALFIMLVLSSAFGIVITINNPYTPTALAISHIEEFPRDTSKLLGNINTFATGGNSPQVLSSNIDNSKRYQYTIEKEDTLSSVARKAISDYLIDNNLILEEHEIELAAGWVVKTVNYNKPINTGDSVWFEENLIMESIEQTQNYN